MSIIFNGVYKPTDVVRGSQGSGGFGAYTEGCTWINDRVIALPATRRPGKTMAKMIIMPGDNCWTSHDRTVIQQLNIHTINPGESWEIWGGFSHMLDPLWQPNGYGWTHLGGMTLNSVNFGGEAYPASLDTGLALLFYNGSNRELSLRLMKSKTPIISDYIVGIWHDLMYHVKFTVTNTGFIEIYHREEGKSNYSIIYSKYNFQTLYNYVGDGKPNDPMYTRMLLYRDGRSTNTQIIYNMEPKIGTTRADVEYIINETICPPLTCNLAMSSTNILNIISNISAVKG